MTGVVIGLAYARFPNRSIVPGVLRVFTLAVALMCSAAIAKAQGGDAGLLGVRHELHGFVTLGRSPQASGEEDRRTAQVKARLQISDHAPDADFFGAVDAEFKDVEANQKSGSEVLIWKAAKCHRSRGLPKITVRGIEATVSRDGEETLVSAVPRHIGKLVPDDEIIITKPTSRSFSNSISEIVMQAQTKRSGIALTLRLTTLSCELKSDADLRP